MRKLIAGCAISAAVFLNLLLARAADTSTDVQNDAQLRAMLAELTRAKTLQLNNLDKPYFVQYATSDAENVTVTASLGGLISSSRVHFREPIIEVRIGDYKFDNTNSIYNGNTRLGLFPLDDDYQAMRNDLWLTTDALYKAATDQITRKRAAIRELADPDNTPDLAPAKPVQVIQPIGALKIDQKHWEELIRQLSLKFTAYPNVINSHVRLRAFGSTYRLVNTEGTIVRFPEDFAEIAIVANAFAADGSRVWNHEFITALHASEFPNEQELQKAAETVAADTDALTKAPVAEDYSGPVLFEQEAAAELMAQVLTDAIRLQRKPLAPPGANDPGAQMLESVWSGRVGSKVTPEWMTIYDNPADRQVHGATLAGHYDIDDEGVPGERVTLVDKGVLKGFLFSRQPIRDFAASNGHGRLPGGWGAEAAVIGNVFVHADNAVPERQLKAKLLEKVKTAGLKYGVIVRRLDFPSTANFQELQNMARQLEKNGYARTLNVPILAYRVYPDGHEELVRGWRFREFSAKDLRDVDAASDRPFVFNYVNNGSSYDLADTGSDITTSSVVCPSLLFAEVELARAEGEAGKLPAVPPPSLTP